MKRTADATAALVCSYDKTIKSWSFKTSFFFFQAHTKKYSLSMTGDLAFFIHVL